MALILHIVKNTNNLPFDRGAERRSVIRQQFYDFDALRERVQPEQILPGKALADDGDARRSSKIPCVQKIVRAGAGCRRFSSIPVSPA